MGKSLQACASQTDQKDQFYSIQPLNSTQRSRLLKVRIHVTYANSARAHTLVAALLKATLEANTKAKSDVDAAEQATVPVKSGVEAKDLQEAKAAAPVIHLPNTPESNTGLREEDSEPQYLSTE